jgi:hypothetical protein
MKLYQRIKVLSAFLAVNQSLFCAQTSIVTVKLQDKIEAQEVHCLYVKKHQESLEDLSVEITLSQETSPSTERTPDHRLENISAKIQRALTQPLNNHPLHPKLKSNSAPVSQRHSPNYSLRELFIVPNLDTLSGEHLESSEHSKEHRSLSTLGSLSARSTPCSGSSSGTSTASTPATPAQQVESIYIPATILGFLERSSADSKIPEP